MENAKHALVLTGVIAPGYSAESVWPNLAGYFGMEPNKVNDQLIPRAPVTVKESDDLTKLRGLQQGLLGLGAECEIHPLDEHGSLFAVIGGRPRGPIPYGFAETRVASGDWSGNVEVAKVGSNTWLAFSRLNAPAAAAVAAPPPPAAATPRAEPIQATAYMAAPRVAAAPVAAASPYAPPEAALVRSYGDAIAAGEMLPSGDTIHAGFWRRFAAYTLDSLILMIPGVVLNFIPLLGILLFYAGRWLYFALMESGEQQATLGKQAFGIKVTNEFGERITFGRATGRFFGGALSNIILGIGYMMAGFTDRKQALHDILANTCVVFGEVQPGQPQPAERPPMPWYGWVLNILAIALPLLAFVVMFIYGFAAYSNR